MDYSGTILLKIFAAGHPVFSKLALKVWAQAGCSDYHEQYKQTHLLKVYIGT